MGRCPSLRISFLIDATTRAETSLRETSLSKQPPSSLDDPFQGIKGSVILSQNDELATPSTDAVRFDKGVPVQ